MTTQPKIKTGILNELYLNIFFQIGSEYREQLAKEYWIEHEYPSDAEYAAFDDYFHQQIMPMADKRFVELYGQHNFTRLKNRSERVIFPILTAFYYRWVSRSIWRMRSRLHRLLANLRPNSSCQ